MSWTKEVFYYYDREDKGDSKGKRNVTTAFVFDPDTKRVCKGVAVCAASDNFVKKKGKGIADSRLRKALSVKGSDNTCFCSSLYVGFNPVCYNWLPNRTEEKIIESYLRDHKDIDLVVDKDGEAADKVKNDAKVHHRVKTLQNMDYIIHNLINDEENGVLDSWLMNGIPDDSSKDDLYEYARDEEVYSELCELFSKLISDLILDGEWSREGFSIEFYNHNSDLVRV